MRIFIAGKHTGADFCRMKEVFFDLEIHCETIRFDTNFGVFTPDRNKEDTEALKSMIEEQLKKSVIIA